MNPTPPTYKAAIVSGKQVSIGEYYPKESHPGLNQPPFTRYGYSSTGRNVALFLGHSTKSSYIAPNFQTDNFKLRKTGLFGAVWMDDPIGPR